MKYFFFTTALACLAVMSCSRAAADMQDTVLMRVGIDSKAVSDVSGGVQLMLFNSDGRLAWGGISGDSSVIRVRSGRGCSLVALGCCPDVFLGGTPSLNDVLDLPVSLAEWNSPDGGFASCAIVRGLDLGAGENDVQLPLRRLASRVVLRSVTLAAGSGLEGAVLENVFLSNVVACRTPGGSGSTWANPMGRSSSDPSHVIDGNGYAADCPELTFYHPRAVLHEGVPFTADRNFYCYPNPCSADMSGGGSASPLTKLVASVRIADRIYYYPVDLHDLHENCSYEVSLVLKNLGSSDPEMPLSQAVLQASVTMSEWAFGKEFITNLSNQIKL